MGLIKYNPRLHSNPKFKNSACFATISPACEDWGPAILQYHHSHWTSQGAISVDSMPRVKFEIGPQGSPHIHIGDVWHTRHLLGRYLKSLTAFIRETYDSLKPDFGDRNKGISVQLYLVPTKEEIGSRVLRGASLINTYLDNPKKEKSTDGGNFTLDITDWTLGSHLSFVQSLAKSDPDIPDFYQASYDRQTAYAKKYLKAQKSKKLPDLDQRIIENQPDITHLEARFSKTVQPSAR